jgi:ATP-dependent RNA helicase RhlE
MRICARGFCGQPVSRFPQSCVRAAHFAPMRRNIWLEACSATERLLMTNETNSAGKQHTGNTKPRFDKKRSDRPRFDKPRGETKKTDGERNDAPRTASSGQPAFSDKSKGGFHAKRGGQKKKPFGHSANNGASYNRGNQADGSYIAPDMAGPGVSDRETFARRAPAPQPKIEPVDSSAFAELGLSHAAVITLSRLGFSTPTPIQKQAIPHGLSGRDVMGLAQTGTGKTAAFGLPLIDHLMRDRVAPMPKAVRSLILAPTRELVNQISDVLRSFMKTSPMKLVTAVGGLSINVQIDNLYRGADVLVATPGRLLDLIDRKAVRLDSAKYLVLDEADQMLDMGFIVPLKKIVKHLPKERQTMLFSATMPKEIEELSKTYLHMPVRVETAPAGKPADKVTQFVHFLERKAKADKLKAILSEAPESLSLVFSRTKHGAEKLMKHLVEAGFKASSIHGNKSQSQRDRAIQSFKAGETRVLVATDVAARGIDIPGVSHVFNFDLPEVPENYVHRIGRTARAGADGIAHAFCAGDEKNLLRAIERLTGKPLLVGSGDIRALKKEEGAELEAKPSGFGGHRDGTKNLRRQDGFVTAEGAGEDGRPARKPNPHGRPNGFRGGKPNGNGGKPGGFKGGNRRPNNNNRSKPQAA